MGRQNGVASMEDGMTILQKIKQNHHMIQPSYLWVYTNRIESRDSKR
jgi:hypothetical protein